MALWVEIFVEALSDYMSADRVATERTAFLVKSFCHHETLCHSPPPIFSINFVSRADSVRCRTCSSLLGQRSSPQTACISNSGSYRPLWSTAMRSSLKMTILSPLQSRHTKSSIATILLFTINLLSCEVVRLYPHDFLLAIFLLWRSKLYEQGILLRGVIPRNTS